MVYLPGAILVLFVAGTACVVTTNTNVLDEEKEQILSTNELDTGEGVDAISSGQNTSNLYVDEGTKLYLTDLINGGDLDAARARALVASGDPFPGNVTSYSGYLTVNKEFNSNLFFWFFPAQYNFENAPVMLWLQGGPSDSSLMGLLKEIGPFIMSPDGVTLMENPYSWHKNHSLLFIDNPVGTGFSFTGTIEGYSRSLANVSENLYSGLVQFFQLFPELQTNPFFIAGESFAGKYVPALGLTIHTKNIDADNKINLKGIAVGNGYTDPLCALNSDFVYQLGLIDDAQKKQMTDIEKQVAMAIHSEQYQDAYMLDTEYNLFRDVSKFTYEYNLLQANAPTNFHDYAKFLESPKVRAKIHVGNTEFNTFHKGHSGYLVQSFSIFDYMKSAKPHLEALLDNYKVLYYSGQLDIIVGYTMSVCMYRSMQWSGADEYKEAVRKPWYVGNELAGYMKSAGKFTEVLVRNAGHMVPADQPAWALDLITRFTTDTLTQQANVDET